MPAELGLKPWTLDYTPDLTGVPDLPQGERPSTGLTYPQSLWDPALVAGLAATEFASKMATWQNFDSVLTPAELNWSSTTPTIREPFIKGELDYLLALMADDRDRYMPEITAQADSAPVYWYQLLDLGAGERPAANALLNFAQRVGEIAALYFKKKYARVRPSTLCPGLLVPFGPPRHPAFPSGHSLTGHLTTYLLLEIPEINAGLSTELSWLADRVAKNRERAGLHYPSDSAAGQKLAQAIVSGLVEGGTIECSTYTAIRKAAKAEATAASTAKPWWP
jgi:hypothetical protein